MQDLFPWIRRRSELNSSSKKGSLATKLSGPAAGLATMDGIQADLPTMQVGPHLPRDQLFSRLFL